MPSLATTILKKFFTGNNYYAIGRKRIDDEGKGQTFYNPIMSAPKEEDIEKHLAGEFAMGAYTLRQDNTIMWMCFDVDSSNLEKARDLTIKLDNLLTSIPHSIEFSGNKGYHIWIFFNKPGPAENVRALAQEM